MAATAYALLGPTASGKSSLALEAARHAPIEIVSMDSALVYRGMDIGTAKPTEAEQRATPHHLIDLVAPDETYSAGRWRQAAITITSGILERKKVPLLVGGTMLYYRALIAGLDDLPPASPELRAEIETEARAKGWPALHAQLAAVDPRAAARISPTDPQRIQRALEVWRLTGRAISDLQGAPRAALPFTLRALCVVPERDALRQRIAERFDAMLAAGLLDELRALRAAYRLKADMPSMRCVGYRQAWEHLEGKTSEAEMRNRAIVATRQLAKRQLTWLRSFPGVTAISDTASLTRALAQDHSFL